MANSEHVTKIYGGVRGWNRWRRAHPQTKPDLSGADLYRCDLAGAQLSAVNLNKADLHGADLTNATLIGATLRGASLTSAALSDANLRDAVFAGANLTGSDLSRSDIRRGIFDNANLSGVRFRRAKLSGARFRGTYFFDTTLTQASLENADLRGVDLSRHTNAELSGAQFAGARMNGANLDWTYLKGTDFTGTNLSGAKCRNAYFSNARLERATLSGALLYRANFFQTDCTDVDFREANLRGASFVDVKLEGARFDRSKVYGLSAWNIEGRPESQRDLLLTPKDESPITVDDLEVAQFIYLLIYNPKIRHVIDTVTSKVVLILGRFSKQQKPTLDRIRSALRSRDYVPLLFDFDKPTSKDVTGTIETLARLSRFVIANLTDPSSIPHELATIIPLLRTTPVALLRRKSSGRYSMIEDYVAAYKGWVLPVYEYTTETALIRDLSRKVLAPVEAKVDELRGNSGRRSPVALKRTRVPRIGNG
jgi:uncharacterized protein YjbI with pentapeptide repeats